MSLPLSAEELRGRARVIAWPPETPLCRAHPHAFGSTEFDRRNTAASRFSTVRFRDRVVPVVYAGENDEAAASESIFHTVPGIDTPVRPRRVLLSKFEIWQWSWVRTARELNMLDLGDDGLAAIGVARAELINGSELSYPSTRLFAETALASLPSIDGLVWRSRQAPAFSASVIFGKVAGRSGGLDRDDLRAAGPAVPFASAPGLEQLNRIATALDIDLIRG